MTLRQDLLNLIDTLSDEQLLILMPMALSVHDNNSATFSHHETLDDRQKHQNRADLAQEIAEVRQEYAQGKVKFGSVADFLTELDNE
jgi:hypothetical protein